MEISEQLKEDPAELSQDLINEIVGIAIQRGIIVKKFQQEQGHMKLGVTTNYSGEGVVELNGVRYKVKAWPDVRKNDMPGNGSVQVYKMRDGQE